MITIHAVTPDDIDTIFDIRDSVKENYLSQVEVAALGIRPDAVAAIWIVLLLSVNLI